MISVSGILAGIVSRMTVSISASNAKMCFIFCVNSLRGRGGKKKYSGTSENCTAQEKWENNGSRWKKQLNFLVHSLYSDFTDE